MTKRIHALASAPQYWLLDSRSRTRAAVLFAVVLFTGAACDDARTDRLTPTYIPERAPLANTTPSSALASLIDTRAQLPKNDAIALAARYRKTDGLAAAAKPYAGDPPAGSSRTFSVSRVTSAALSHDAPPTIINISATLLATTTHGYFYADDAIKADPVAMREAAELFEASVWPQVTSIFGEPANPGVDGDPRIIVLQADLGGAIGGYYTGDDAYLKSVRPLSNEAEIIYIDRTLRPGASAFNTVVAHELQHLVHNRNDSDEEAWVNEGLSEAALLLAGGAPTSMTRFATKPETQLNDWPSAGTGPHYGAGAAFMRYLALRLGGDPTLGGIARDSADGPAGVDAYLEAEAPSLSFRSLFADWIAANVLNVASGLYANPDPIETKVQFEISPGDDAHGAVHQFGTDYYALTDVYDGGDFVLSFEGESTAAVLPPPSLSDGPVWWSNAGDEIDTRLTYALDLTPATTPAFTFRSWYDIESWYDFGYVSVSTDNGATWEALPSDHTTTDDPIQLAFGPGRYGRSGGGEQSAWQDERVDVSRFAGQRILLRLEYVTDGGTHGRGWAIRDVRLDGVVLDAPPLADGWAYLDAPLPQDYVVRLLLTMQDGTVAVRDVTLDDARAGELQFSTAGVADAVLAIAGATEGTNELAPYHIELIQP